MRFGRREETSRASNPGGVVVKPLVYARYFPAGLHGAVLGGVLLVLGLALAIPTRGAGLLLPLLGFRFAMRGWRKMKSVEDHFLNGCALPGVVVALDPITVASLTNLSTGPHAVYDTVKVVTMPNLARVRGRRFATGDRVPVVAKYAGRMPTPKWDNFFPSPVIFATDDPAEIARVEDSIGEANWQELNDALFQIPKPYHNGLFPVTLPQGQAAPPRL